LSAHNEATGNIYENELTIYLSVPRQISADEKNRIERNYATFEGYDDEEVYA